MMKAQTVAILESRLGVQLADLISKRGGRPVLAPALSELPDVDPAYLARFIVELERAPARVAIFQTGVGTQALFGSTDQLGLTGKLLELLASTTVLVRGPKPTAALRARGVRIDLSARDPFTTAEVLELLEDLPIHGERIVVQRYGVTNEKLHEVLSVRGAQVIEVPTYRWALPEDTQPLVSLMDALERREIDATVFTNAAQVRNLFALAERLERKTAVAAGLSKTIVASIGPVCTAALKEFGIIAALEPSPPKLGPLVSALDEILSRQAGSNHSGKAIT